MSSPNLNCFHPIIYVRGYAGSKFFSSAERLTEFSSRLLLVSRRIDCQFVKMGL